MFSLKPGQRNLPFVILAEPVDVEDARSDGEAALHLDPVTEVVAHVVAAEGEHGHGVAADFADVRLPAAAVVSEPMVAPM